MRPDAEVQRPVDSSKVPEKEFCDRTRPVSTDRTLGVQRPVEYSKVCEGYLRLDASGQW